MTRYQLRENMMTSLIITVQNPYRRLSWRRLFTRSVPLAVAALLSTIGAISGISMPAAFATSTPIITAFNTGDEYIHTGSSAYISVTLSAAIDNSTYFVRITDLTAGTILTTCTHGTYCAWYVYSSNATTHTYSAHLDSGNGGPAPYPIVSAPPNRSINWVATLPSLTGGSVSFHTNNGDRDWDTTIYVDVYKRNGSYAGRLIVPNGERFSENSDHGPYSISPVLPAAYWDDIRGGGHLMISIVPNGNDTWPFNYSGRLNFSNGRYIWFSGNNIQLTQDDSRYTQTLSF